MIYAYKTQDIASCKTLLPLRCDERNPSFVSVFEELGKTINVPEIMIKDLEKFVCCMYGKPNYTNVNKLRYDLFAQKYQGRSGQLLSSYDGVDLSLLPPCRGSLQMHIQGANNQALFVFMQIRHILMFPPQWDMAGN